MPNKDTLDPLALPMCMLDLSCESERPFVLRPGAGKTPGTLFNGRLRQLMYQLQPELAHQLFDLSLPWEPGRKLPPLALVATPSLWEGHEQQRFPLQLRLLGPQAVAAESICRELLVHLGASGLNTGHEKALHFTVAPQEQALRGNPRSLGEHMLSPGPLATLDLEFVTPLQLPKKFVDNAGKTGRMFQRGEEFDLVKLLGNLAYDLMSVSLRATGETDAKRAKAQCNAMRAQAEKDCGGIELNKAEFSQRHYGWRRSVTQKGQYSLEGFVGRVQLEGDLAPAVPWLAALSAWRGAQKAAKGFGLVSIWSHVG